MGGGGVGGKGVLCRWHLQELKRLQNILRIENDVLISK